MPISLNMGDVNQPIPEGTYVFRIGDCDIVQSKSGNDQLAVKLVVIQPAEQVDRVVMDYFPLVENALWRLQPFLNAATGKDWDQDEMELDEKELIGLFVRGTTFIDEYNGQKRAKVREYFADIEYPTSSAPNNSFFAEPASNEEPPF